LRGARRLSYADPQMRNLLLALLHLAVVTVKLCGAGGVRAVIAENLLLKHQLIVLRRARKRAPNLTSSDRLLCGFWSIFLSPGPDMKTICGGAFADPAAFNGKVKVLFLGIGAAEGPGTKTFSEALTKASVKNVYFESPETAHEWLSWRRALNDFAPRLFR
jgi:hypothetical protein